MKRWSCQDVGCYGDSARGQYMGEHVQGIAESEGWTGARLNADHEWYCDAWDQAEGYLNRCVADDDHYFGSSEAGDWGYWPTEDHEKDCEAM